MKRKLTGLLCAAIIAAVALALPSEDVHPPEGDPERIAEIMAELREDMGSQYAR